MSLNSGANFSVNSSFELTGENPEETQLATGTGVLDGNYIQFPLGIGLYLSQNISDGDKFTLNVNYYVEVMEDEEPVIYERYQKLELTTSVVSQN